MFSIFHQIRRRTYIIINHKPQVNQYNFNESTKVYKFINVEMFEIGTNLNH